MAKSAIIGRIIQLAQRLGANPSKFAGTRSNITFLGSGPSNELFSQSLRINELPGLFVAGTGKLKPQILSKVDSGAAFAMAGKLSTPQLKTLEASFKAMDNLRLGLVKPRGIVNTESFRELGRRGAKGSEFREMGIALKAQKAKGFKEAMEAADDLIIEGSGGLITRSQLKNLSPEALKNLRLEYAPDIMARFFKPKMAGGGRVHLAGGTSPNVLGPARKAYNSVYGYDAAGNEVLVKDLYDDFGSFLEMFKMSYHAEGGIVKDKGLANILAV